jgi:hypothetical protein
MAVARVHYRERQRLLSADFIAEQSYRLGAAGRHYLGPHLWGVVRGLRLLKRGNNWILNPGLAIDGYGREIVVPEPVRVTGLKPDQCMALVLYYCEFPEQLEPSRCPVEPAPRIGHRFRLVPSVAFVPPTIEPELARGRAAGAMGGLPPWPVLVARAGSECFEDPDDVPTPPVTYAATRYVRHRAGILRAPTGRAVLQLGPMGRKDIYHFLLSTRNTVGALEKRIGIDRDRTVRIWRPLVIVGDEAEAEVMVSAQASIRIKSTMPTGTAPRLLVNATLDRTTGVLTTSLVESGRRHAPHVIAMPLRRNRALSTELVFPHGRVAHLELLEGSKAVPPFVRPAGERHGERSEPVFESFAVEAMPTGGALVMKEPVAIDEADEPLECGEVERVRASRKAVGPPVVQFKPGTGQTPSAVVREIHAVPVELEDLIPRSELRISGGPFDDKDPYVRFAVGDRRAAGWSPALAMNGWGKLVMGRRPEPNTPPAPVLKVTGTVYLPPVGKNDPLLPDLMAQAFIAGLLEMGQAATEVTLAFEGLPAKIVNEEDFEYKLKITRVGAQVVKIKRGIELITAVAGGSDVVIDSIENLPPELTNSTAQVVTVKHTAFTIAATKVRITAQLILGIGTATRVAELESAEIPVEESIT